jgi:protein-S-isoprenylcysteine O-methyltransferase Ste14
VLPDNWFYAPQFQFGLLCFFTGMFINIQSDAILRQLRQQSCSYQIPRGGSFEYVSAPHYFGEVLEWIGFCTACNFSNASLAFVIFTASNLIPRAIAHHKWYQTAFSGKYPASRKAIIPFVW